MGSGCLRLRVVVAWKLQTGSLIGSRSGFGSWGGILRWAGVVTTTYGEDYITTIYPVQDNLLTSSEITSFDILCAWDYAC